LYIKKLKYKTINTGDDIILHTTDEEEREMSPNFLRTTDEEYREKSPPIITEISPQSFFRQPSVTMEMVHSVTTETFDMVIPSELFDTVFGKIQIMGGIDFTTPEYRNNDTSPYFKTLCATFNPDMAWLLQDSFNTIAEAIKHRVSNTVEEVAQKLLQEKTGHWRRGNFISSENCILDTVEQTKMFMGSKHKNKKLIEKEHNVCIYIITAARLDTSSRVLVAPQTNLPNQRVVDMQLVLDDIEKRIFSIKQSTIQKYAFKQDWGYAQ